MSGFRLRLREYLHTICLFPWATLNAKVGDDRRSYERVMGSNGCDTMNDNGKRLVDLCAVNNLVVGSTLFSHKEIHKLTWVSPNSQDKNQIDNLL